MNRAWIPAGALATVSVAGLIALGPLTEGMKVDFPESVPAPAASTTHARVVAVRLDTGAIGDTSTVEPAVAIANSRGKEATPPLTNGDEGRVSLNKRYTIAATGPAKAKPKAAAKKKPAVKRQASIGTYGEANSDTGLAGGEPGSTAPGEQIQTPAGN
jgi:hypothetical protein